MKTSFLAVLFFVFQISLAQNQDFNISWEDSRLFESGIEQLYLPFTDDLSMSFSYDEGLYLYKEWAFQGSSATSIEFSNLSFEDISKTQLNDLDPNLVPTEVKTEYGITSARGSTQAFFKIAPIIIRDGRYQRLVSFSISLSAQGSRSANFTSNQNTVTNSVLASGQWYKFYVEESGIYRLDRNFLNDIGINTNGIDPRNIQIYGNGGRMIPLSNEVDHPIDPTETSIWVSGESDGVFNDNDYLLFYAEGPKGKHQHDYNQQFNSNLNLYNGLTLVGS